MRTIEWDYSENKLALIDQRLLPGEFKINKYEDYQNVAEAITTMVVRGAPAIGATAAFGLVLASLQSQAVGKSDLLSDLYAAGAVLKDARPTAVNLEWAVKRVIKVAEKNNGDVEDIRSAVLTEAQNIADEDVE
ncbi:S-methyl-5-thioribose-1-phosphate isomerase, partial [Chloroflexota bacterium]